MSAPRVAVVTDSTADVPADLAARHGLRVVPLSVRFGDREVFSRVGLDDEEFYRQLAAAEELPTTSRPVPAWFEEAWADAADEGCEAVVSIHVSGALSGTVDGARAAAGAARIPVHVVDSRQVSGGLALQVLAAQRAAAAGADAAAVLAEVAEVAAGSRTFVVVDSLGFLRRGGRLSASQAAVGTALRVKPVLAVEDGALEIVDRTRTWSRARDRLVALAVEHAQGRPVDVVVGHGLVPARADELLEALEAALTVASSLQVVVGPVVGTHVGPGAVGLSVAPAR